MYIFTASTHILAKKYRRILNMKIPSPTHNPFQTHIGRKMCTILKKTQINNKRHARCPTYTNRKTNNENLYTQKDNMKKQTNTEDKYTLFFTLIYTDPCV